MLSNPSQCSIEVLSQQGAQQQQEQGGEVEVYPAAAVDDGDGADDETTVAVPEPELKTSALTPLPKKLNPMVESSSSGKVYFAFLIQHT